MAKDKTSVIFTGDIGFDRYMDRRWEDDGFLSASVLEFFDSAEHTVANVEGALIEAEDNGSHGSFFHCMNPAATRVLKRMGADIWSIGNNHTMDAGVEGVISTRKIAAELGVATIGAGLNIDEASRPAYIDEAGGIGMFCVAYMTECIPATESSAGIFRWDDFERISQRIREIKSRCRWCVIVCHGGEEFSSLPNPYTRDRYLKFIEMGADVVVGHHPHVPENYELLPGNKAIFYSLGNFIFDTDYQRVHLYTDTGVLLKLIFTENELDFEALGIKIVRGEERIESCPLPDVFVNIPDSEYKLLAPLNAKAFVQEDRRTQTYLNPAKYKDAPESVWNEYFFSENTDGFFPLEHMDFNVIVPFSKQAESGEWKKSKLEKVKEYILRQL
ncbi:MAG: CapA family protein [Clostridia bacterium]|nr:CapA family protein [Clostridia bacterium]